MSQERLLSVHYLRAVAALLVVYAHYIAVAAFDTVGVAQEVGPHLPLPVIGPEYRSDIAVYSLVDRVLQTGFDSFAGPLGVAIFFVISGFLIPLSLERYTPKQFLVSRFFRIYPLCIAGLCCIIVVVTAYNGIVHGARPPYTATQVLASFTLLQDVFAKPPVTGIMWTLTVEWVFYLISAAVVQRGGYSIKVILWLSLAFLGMATIYLAATPLRSSTPELYRYIRIAAHKAVFVSYMLAGVCMYGMYRCPQKIWQYAATLCLVFVVFLATLSLYNRSPTPFPGTTTMASFLLAIVAMAMGLLCEKYMPRIAGLDFLARISYPLYVVHGPTGWILLGVLLPVFANVHIALMVTFSLVILLATALHGWVEVPATRYGKYLARRMASPVALRPVLAE